LSHPCLILVSFEFSRFQQVISLHHCWAAGDDTAGSRVWTCCFIEKGRSQADGVVWRIDSNYRYNDMQDSYKLWNKSCKWNWRQWCEILSICCRDSSSEVEEICGCPSRPQAWPGASISQSMFKAATTRLTAERMGWALECLHPSCQLCNLQSGFTHYHTW
jgi:hypothetical protein